MFSNNKNKNSGKNNSSPGTPPDWKSFIAKIKTPPSDDVHTFHGDTGSLGVPIPDSYFTEEDARRLTQEPGFKEKFKASGRLWRN